MGKPCIVAALVVALQLAPQSRASALTLIRIVPVRVVGALSRDTVKRVFRLHRNEVTACYERGLQRSPALEGRLTVVLHVDSEGTTLSATPKETTLGDPKVVECIVDRLSRFEFPRVPDGGPTLIKYRFRFAPRKAPGEHQPASSAPGNPRCRARCAFQMRFGASSSSAPSVED